MEQSSLVELEAAVARARGRAARTGELEPVVTGSPVITFPSDLVDFVQQILSDGTYARAVERIGEEDPDLASI
jgi:hypothetical protein